MKNTYAVRYRQFIANIQKVINEAGLPAFAMIPVVREALQQLIRQDELQYQNGLKQASDGSDASNGGQENQ